MLCVAASTSTRLPKRAVSPPLPSQDEASAEGSGDEEEEDGSNAENTRSDAGDASDSDDEGDPTQMVHESLLKGDASATTSRHGKTKHVPTEETAEQRDARTVFVGNVAVEVTKSRVRLLIFHSLRLRINLFGLSLSHSLPKSNSSDTFSPSSPLLRSSPSASGPLLSKSPQQSFPRTTRTTRSQNQKPSPSPVSTIARARRPGVRMARVETTRPRRRPRSSS